MSEAFDNATINQMLLGTIPVRCPELTQDNRVQSASVTDLANYIKLYGMCHGFTVNQNSERGGRSGYFYCGQDQAKKASASLRTDVSLGVLDASIGGSMAVNSAPIKSNCPWMVRYNDVQDDGKVNLTRTRNLEHSKHEMNPLVAGETRTIERAQEVTEIERTMLEKLLANNKINKPGALKQTMQDIYGRVYEDNVFQSMVRRARFNTKIPDGHASC